MSNKRHFIFKSLGINSETHEEEWILYEDIEQPWYRFKFTETKKYDHVYTAKEIVDFLKLFSLNNQITLEFT